MRSIRSRRAPIGRGVRVLRSVILAAAASVSVSSGLGATVDVTCGAPPSPAGPAIVCRAHTVEVRFTEPLRNDVLRIHGFTPGSGQTVVFNRGFAFSVTADERGVVTAPTGARDVWDAAIIPQDGSRQFDYALLGRRRFVVGWLSFFVAVASSWVFLALTSARARRCLLVLLPVLLFLFCTRTEWNRIAQKSGRWGEAVVAREFDSYRSSQYVLGWNDPNKEVISDQQIYAWAGWMYAHGTSPDLVNPEHPPLGKYLLGWSARFLGDPVIATLVAGCISILFVTLISFRIFNSPMLALVAPSLLATSRLVFAYTCQSYLEAFVLAVFSLGIYLVLRSDEDRPPIAVAVAVLLGLGMAVKWSCAVLAVLAVAHWASKKSWSAIASFVASTPLTIAAYLATYSSFFAEGHTLRDLIALQSAVSARWSSIAADPSVPLFSLWRILFTGYAVYGDYRTSNYSILWPVYALLAIAGTVLAIRKRRFDVALCGGWFLGYVLFFSKGPTWDRYLVPALPGAVLTSVWYLAQCARLLWNRIHSTVPRGTPA